MAMPKVGASPRETTYGSLGQVDAWAYAILDPLGLHVPEEASRGVSSLTS